MLKTENEIALCEKHRELNNDLKNNCSNCPLSIDERLCVANSTKINEEWKSDFE